jgi:Trk K+ transport system NAD-binding subunit
VVEGLLAQRAQVVVVERHVDSPFLGRARALGVPVVLGDATLDQTLDAVNLEAAAGVAVLTSDDMTNIETGLAARDRLAGRWHDVPVVLRVFDRQLGHRLEASFGFRHVWSTSAIAAPWFVGAALGMEVLFTFYVGNHPFLLARLRVSAGGGLDDLAMRELPGRIRVVAIRRAQTPEQLEHPPRRDTRLAPGDDAYLAGPYEELLEVLRHDRSPAAGGAR